MASKSLFYFLWEKKWGLTLGSHPSNSRLEMFSLSKGIPRVFGIHNHFWVLTNYFQAVSAWDVGIQSQIRAQIRNVMLVGYHLTHSLKWTNVEECEKVVPQSPELNIIKGSLFRGKLTNQQSSAWAGASIWKRESKWLCMIYICNYSTRDHAHVSWCIMVIDWMCFNSTSLFCINKRVPNPIRNYT